MRHKMMQRSQECHRNNNTELSGVVWAYIGIKKTNNETVWHQEDQQRNRLASRRPATLNGEWTSRHQEDRRPSTVSG